MTARARRLLAKGYQRLVSYEVKGGGFSWFGESPANQVLTAYGLMQFADMAEVYRVDPELVARTQRWLASKQRADGAWTPDQSWLHDWKAVQGPVATTAYIAWALAEAGARGPVLDRALQFLDGHREALAASPYLLALWAAAETGAQKPTSLATSRGTGSRGPSALELLRARGERVEDGLRFGAAGQTLFYARGRAADAQVTALAVHALQRQGHLTDAQVALRWLWSARARNHGWGSTQGTVLALRAAARMSGSAPRKGRLRVRLDGRALGEIDLAAAGVPELGIPTDLAPGRHVFEVEGEAEGLQADLRASWRKGGVPQALVSGLEVKLSGPKEPVGVGRTTEMMVTLRNPGSEVVAMPTVVVPVPPGFQVAQDSLQGLPVARHEDLGRVLHLYLQKLEPGRSLALPYRLRAKAEVEVTQRAARAYAYYDPEISGASGILRLRAAR